MGVLSQLLPVPRGLGKESLYPGFLGLAMGHGYSPKYLIPQHIPMVAIVTG